MSDQHYGNTQPAIDQEEHEHTIEPATKRVLCYGYDGSSKQIIKTNSDGEIAVNLETSDIEIGAVEIKNATDNTRATVGSNGLYVDVRALNSCVTEVNLAAAVSDNAIGISGAKYSLQSNFESTAGWSASAGADNLTTSTDHRGAGTYALEFDKIAGNAVAMISKTVTSFDMSKYSDHAIGLCHMYISSLTNVANCFVRIGTDASNYCEWQFADTLLSEGWNQLQENITMPTSQTGNGYNLSAITYLAFGVTFDDAANTLTDIRTGGWSVKRVLETATVVNADVAVDTPWIGIKDRNSNTRMDVAGGTNYNYLLNRITDGTDAVDVTANGELEVSLMTALPAGTNNIGDVDIISAPAIVAGTNWIGLTTTAIASAPTLYAVVNTTAAGQASVVLDTGTNWIGLATTTLGSAPTLYAVVNTGAAGQSSVVLDTGTNWVGLATTTIGSAPTIYAVVNTGAAGQSSVVLDTGANWIGLATVSLGAALPAGNSNIGDVDIASIAAGNNNIGDVDVASIAAGDNNIGNVDIASIAAGTTSIGFATVQVASIAAGSNNIGDVDVASIAAGNNNIGDVDVASIAAGTSYIGLATVTQAVATTLASDIVSAASGGLTRFATHACKWVTVRMMSSNPTTAYIGGSNASINNGYAMEPGESIGFEVNNSNLLYLVGVGTTSARYIIGN